MSIVSKLVRCGLCRGAKTYRGIGNMQKDCDACGAIGWVEEAAAEVIQAVIPPVAQVVEQVVEAIVKPIIEKKGKNANSRKADTEAN